MASTVEGFDASAAAEPAGKLAAAPAAAAAAPAEGEAPATRDQLRLKGVIGFNGKVTGGLRLHPDDKHILFPLGSTLVKKHLLNNTQTFLQRDGHDQTVSCMAVSRDGRLMASGQVSHIGFPAVAIVWDLDTCEVRHRLSLHKGKVEALAFSASGKYLATLGGEDDKRVIVWDVATGVAICGAQASNENSLCVSWFNGNEEQFVTGGVRNLRVWTIDRENRKLRSQDVALGQLKRHILCMSLDDDDQRLYCGTSTGDVLKVNLRHAAFEKLGPQKHSFSRGVHALVRTARGNLVAGCGDGTVAVLRADTMRCVRKMKIDGFVSSLELNAAGDHFFVGTRECNVYLVHLASFDYELRTTCHSSGINDVAFPHGYSELFATCSNNDLRVWNSRDRTELLRIQVPNKECLCAAFSVDGKLILSGWSDGKIRAFLPQSGKLKWLLNDAHAGGVTALACTADSRTIVSGGNDGNVRVWSVGGGLRKMVASMKEHKQRVNSIQLNEDDSQCISSSSDGSCIVWDLARFVRSVALFASTQFHDARYHPDQSQLLTTGTDRKITYWDAVDGKPIRIMDGSPAAELSSLDIAADGETFVSVGNDRLVRRWGYDEGHCSSVGVGHSGNVNKVRISPDQTFAVSVGSEGAIFIWDLPAQ